MILISLLPRDARRGKYASGAEYRRAWRAANREHVKAYKRKWKLENPDKVAAESRTERARERRRKVREKEKSDPVLRERRRAYGRAFSRTEKGRALRAKQIGTPKTKARRQRWIATGGYKAWKESPSGSEAIRRARHNRLQARRGVVCALTLEEWTLLLEQYKERCAYCGDPGEMTRDHVVPITKSGDDVLDNVVPACRSCNSKKRDKMPALAFKEFGVDAAQFWARHEQIVATIRGIS